MEDNQTQEDPQNGTQQTPATPETQGTQQTLKAQLDEEQKAKAAAEAALVEKDARIVELEASLSEAKQGSEATAAELVSIKEAHGLAIGKYLDAVKAANPTIPLDIIAGATIEEIDVSVEKAQSIATAVRASLEAQAKEARVPAGAPLRESLNIDGLSPREKIVAGIQQKQGGNS